MPHAFVVAHFNPGQSAWWLPPSGQLTASKFATRPFWAIRFDYKDDREAPRLLCAVSSRPSPLPMPHASFTLGPKIATNSSEVWHAEGTQLVVEPPLQCEDADLIRTLYLHTAPRMFVLHDSVTPLGVPLHQLEDDSFRRFKEAVEANEAEINNFWGERRRAFLIEQLPHPLGIAPDDLLESIFNGPPDPTCDVPGQMNNPHKYDFEFSHAALPFCDFPTSVYDEILVYAQLFKDYKWPGVEANIAWVRARRAARAQECQSRKHIRRPQTYVSRADEVDVQDSLKQDPVFFAHARRLARIDLNFDASGGSDYSGNTGRTADEARGDDAKYIFISWLPWDFPLLAHVYPRISLPRSPKVVVLDMFGVLLNREGAIRHAIERWLPLAGHRLDIKEAVLLYVELEALAARKHGACATSLGTIVHAALQTLIRKLGLQPSWHSVFFADAAATILRPRPYEDVESAIDALVQRGCTVVGLVPFSNSTLDTLHPMLSERVLTAMWFFPVAIPVHIPVSGATFFPALMKWCQRSLNCSDLGPQDVVVASGGVGRIIGPASVHRHPTVLVRRPECVECNVDFMVGEGERSPSPSVVCESLGELASLAAGVRIVE